MKIPPKSRRLGILMLGLLLTVSAVVRAGVQNPGFDRGTAGWKFRNTKNSGEVRAVQDKGGNKCLRFHKTRSTTSWSSIGVSQQISVEPGALYRIGFRYKTALQKDAPAHAFRIFIEPAKGGAKAVSRKIAQSTDWSVFKWSHRIGRKTDAVKVSILLTYVSGDVWIDDIIFEKISSSCEAELFPVQNRAKRVSRPYLGEGKGVRIGKSGWIEKEVFLDQGAWKIRVYGDSDGPGDLFERAVAVQLGDDRKVGDLHKTGGKSTGRDAVFLSDQPAEYRIRVSMAPEFGQKIVLDRVVWTAHDGPGEVRPLFLNTRLVVGGNANAVIVAPDNPVLLKSARELQRALKSKSGATLKIVNDRQWMDSDYTSKNAVCIGNMLENKLSERLYCLWYTREDSWYPGKGGWVVRTVHDPWGTGKNVIVLSGSDDKGTRRAVTRLESLLKTGPDLSIQHTLEVELSPDVSRGIGKANPKSAKGHLKKLTQRALFHHASRSGIRYLCKGDPEFVREFLIYMKEHKRRQKLGADTHMELWKVIRAWDIVEECPFLTEEDRLETTNYLLYVLRSKEGVANGMFTKALGETSVRHNHHMLAAMDAYYGGQYFKKYYDLPEAGDWIAKAEFCFSSQEFHEKGQDESGNYEARGAIWPLVCYAYTEPDYKFFPSNTAKKYLDRLCIAVDNRFAVSGYGDCWNANTFPLMALCVGAWFYKDPGYQFFVEKRFRQMPNERNRLDTFPPFRVHGKVEAEKPDRFEGISSAGLGGGHYDYYKKAQAQELLWNVPFEKTFDKLSFRSGFGKEKQYMLLDGIACGSHGHFDANCIIRFTDNDRVWIVDDAYTEGPFLWDHNGVVVTRNGISGKMPACAKLVHYRDMGECGFSLSVLPDHSGVDWERHIVWLKEKCFIVLDRMTANTDGEYGFRCLWRTLGSAEIQDNQLITSQTRMTPKREDLMNISFGRDVTPELTKADDMFCERWKSYKYCEPIVNIHAQNMAKKMSSGQDFTFQNLIYASNAFSPVNMNLIKINETTALITGDENMLVKIGDGNYMNAPVSIASSDFLMREKSLSAIKAREILLNSQQVLKSKRAVDIFLDFKDGAGHLVSGETNDIVLFGKTVHVGKGKHIFSIPKAVNPKLQDILKKAVQSGNAGVQKNHNISGQNHGPSNTPQTQSVEILPYRVVFDAGSPVTAMAKVEKNIALGTDDGIGYLIDKSGKKLWSFNTGGRINAMSSGDLNADGKADLVFGSEDGNVYAVDHVGRELWHFHCPPYPTWKGKKGQVRDILMDDLDGDGKAETIVGANNVMLHVLNSRGTSILNIENRDPHAIFDNFSAMDMDGDNVKEILSFPSTGSFGSVHEWNLSGEQNRIRADGWPSQICCRAEGDLDGDGKTDIAYGTSRGNVYYRMWEKGRLGNKKVYSVGTKVSNIGVCESQNNGGQVAVVTDMSYLHLLDKKGKPLWQIPVKGPISHLRFIEVSAENWDKSQKKIFLVIGSKAGTVKMIDMAGKLAGKCNVSDSAVTAMIFYGKNILAGGEDGRVTLIQTKSD